jgi:hypothetical protein
MINEVYITYLGVYFIIYYDISSYIEVWSIWSSCIAMLHLYCTLLWYAYEDIDVGAVTTGTIIHVELNNVIEQYALYLISLHHCIWIMKGDIYYYMHVVLSMKISTILLFICNLICLNCCLMNCDLNNLLNQFACWGCS